ncbi:MAG: 3-isopropylmalate dehydratase small subunit [Verrucomicrobia bacterium]|nr:3-isopropylmalate dehydratase small subunit [Verrucomicrobiota bacterium]
MEPFQIHRGIIATLDRANVDTDQIIPKQFLKSIKRTGFGESLFFDWKQLPSGADDPDFELNQPRFKNASVLVVRNNFGCGSSREHAVWAVVQAGYRAVIAPRKDQGGNRVPAFADIFAGNSVKNGLLTIELGEGEVDDIFARVERREGLEATIDLVNQRVVLHDDKDVEFPFSIDPAVKDTLIKGLDDIDQTLLHESSITAFEATHNPQYHG